MCSSFRGAQALALKAWFSAPTTVLGQKWGLLAVATAPSCLLTVSSFLPKRRRLITMLSRPQWTRSLLDIRQKLPLQGWAPSPRCGKVAGGGRKEHHPLSSILSFAPWRLSGPNPPASTRPHRGPGWLGAEGEETSGRFEAAVPFPLPPSSHTGCLHFHLVNLGTAMLSSPHTKNKSQPFP